MGGASIPRGSRALIVGLYNNNYSRMILEDVVRESGGQFRLINIGKTNHVTSEFCAIASTGVRGQIKVLKMLERFILACDEIVEVVVPNNNNIVTNFMEHLYISGKVEKLSQVAEGTLNYHSRRVDMRELSNRVLKKIASIIFGFKYRFSLRDHMDLISSRYWLYCRVAEGVNSTSTMIRVVEEEVGKVEGVVGDPGLVLIVGQHILDRVSRPLRFDFLGAIEASGIPVDGVKFFYLPHPRCVNFEKELSFFYGDFPVKVIGGYDSAESCIRDIKPKYIVALGGSTLFLDAFVRGGEMNLYAMGMNYLYKQGFTQYKELSDFHKRLGVKVYG